MLGPNFNWIGFETKLHCKPLDRHTSSFEVNGSEIRLIYFIIFSCIRHYVLVTTTTRVSGTGNFGTSVLRSRDLPVFFGTS